MVDGLELLPSIIFPSELFWRQLRFGDFDISEMSFSSLIKTIARGDDRWVGLPIFMTRRFFHTEMIARTDRGIQTPADLKGKLVGVPEYQQPRRSGPGGSSARIWCFSQRYGILDGKSAGS